MAQTIFIKMKQFNAESFPRLYLFDQVKSTKNFSCKRKISRYYRIKGLNFSLNI